MPELERYMLSRLAELNDAVREGYWAFDFKRAFHALLNFAVNDLSAFYFDIRKDSLYCDRYASQRGAPRYGARQSVRRLTAWLAPMLCFTTEEVWLSRFPGEGGSVHLWQFPETRRVARRGACGEMAKVREVRRVITGALEIERKEGDRLDPRSRTQGLYDG